MDENYNMNNYGTDESSGTETNAKETMQTEKFSEENGTENTEEIQMSQNVTETGKDMRDPQTKTADGSDAQPISNNYGTQSIPNYNSNQSAPDDHGTMSASNGYSTSLSSNGYGSQQTDNSSTYGNPQGTNAYGAQQYGGTNYGTVNRNPYQQYRNPYQQYQSMGAGYTQQAQSSQNAGYGQQAQNSQNTGYGQQPRNSQNNGYGQQTPPSSNGSGSSKKERKKGGVGAFLGKAVAAALIFGLIGGGVFTGVSYVGTSALGLNTSNDDEDFNTNSDTDSSADSSSASDTDSSSSSDTVSTTDTSATAADLTDVSGVVEEVMPSIVAITNISTTTYDSMWGGSQTYETTSLGSGIIIDQDDEYLYICTNNHVVSGSESLTVQFVDDSTVSAEITGTDSSDDLAVIQVALSSIEEDTLSQIKVAAVNDSGDVKVGEAVIAIGNALGYGQSVTTGVVSATGRTVSVTDSTTGTTVTNTNLIQTDAAINSGNSGGALLNANGEVIGINAAKYSATGVEGIGYAIPMSDAYAIIKALINGDDIPQSAYLGISGQTVSSDVASQYNVPVGVLVSEVIAGTAADEAGIQAGDIITAIDGEELTSMDDLKSYLAGLKEGDQVTITLSRQTSNYSYKEMDVEVTLGGQSTTSE